MDNNTNYMDDNKIVSDRVPSSIETSNNFETNRETNSSVTGDIDLSQSDVLKTFESREDRFKRLKEKTEFERQKKCTEIVESQRLSSELRQRQQEDRRKKLEEIKQKEDARKRMAEQRRQEMDAKEKEKNENFLKRTKEREERALILQKQIRMTSSMTQSMILTNQNRLTTSVHSSGASSGSEKCMKVFNRSSSGCDVDCVSSYVLQAAGHKSANFNTPSCTRKKYQSPKIPDGFIEVDGNIIPANTRHAGCFVPYKGSHHRVKGVLAWGPPPDRVSEKGTCVSWWAGIGDHVDHHHHLRATSAHTLLTGSHVRNHLSTPQHLDKISLVKNKSVDIDKIPKNERSESDVSSNVSARLSVKLMKTMSLRRLDPTNNNFGKETPRIRSSSRTRANVTPVTPPTVRTSRQPISMPTTNACGDKSVYDRLSAPRSGSQPPKNRQNDSSLEVTPKIMSASFVKHTPRLVTSRTPTLTVKQHDIVPPAMTNTVKKSSLSTAQKLKAIPTGTTDSSLTSCPVSDKDHLQGSTVVNDTDGIVELANISVTSTTTIDTPTEKPRTKKTSNKVQLNKEPEPTPTVDSTITSSVSADNNAIVSEEEMYRLKLAEQRRLKREAKEKQLEEQRKMEEEAKEKAVAERKQMEKETRRVIEEESRRMKELKLQEEEEIERQRLEEETERVKKEEIERDLEEKRREKLRADDLDRMERKRRLEQIMTRVKKADDSNGVMNEEMNGSIMEGTEQSVICEDGSEQVLEMTVSADIRREEEDDVLGKEASEPVNVWIIGSERITASTETVSRDEKCANIEVAGDDVVTVCHDNDSMMTQSQIAMASIDSMVPSATTECSQPQFKSRLLQSMMAKGRLATSTNDVRRASINNNNNNNNNSNDSLFLSENNNGPTGDKKRQSLVLSQINGDQHSSNDPMPHSFSYNSGISKMSLSMTDCEDQSRHGLEYADTRTDSGLSNGNAVHHSDSENEAVVSTNKDIVTSEQDTDGHRLITDTTSTSCGHLSVTDDRQCVPVVSHALESL